MSQNTDKISRDTLSANIRDHCPDRKDCTSIVLLRKILQDVSKIDIFNALSSMGEINDIQIITKKHYAYVDYRDIDSAIKCVEYHQKNALILGGIEVNCYMVGPESSNLKPLDLNPPSKII